MAAVSTLVALLVSLLQLGLPTGSDRDLTRVHASDEGSLLYRVHLPPQHAEGGEPLPVVMALHGCGMTGFGWNSMRDTTQLDALADQEGFITVYPTQQVGADHLNCWRSDDPRDQRRGQGEPALLAGIVEEVVAEHGADPDRVHVTGASSGAGAAVILGVTYPDVFASVTSVAGGEYGLDQVDPEHPDATPPTFTAGQAYAQMGERARHVPLLVVQGAADDVVPPIVGQRLVEQWSAIGDLIDDGLANGTVDVAPTATSTHAPDGLHAYTHTVYSTPGAEDLSIESYVVEDMGHAWSGPDAEGLFTDQAGPDVSRILWDFVQSRRLPT